MDTATVLEIIKMIDTNVTALEDAINTEENLLYEDKINLETRIDALVAFRDHLQSFIEGQLNAAENSTGE